MTKDLGENSPLSREVARINQHTRQMISEYVSWHDKIMYENHLTMYSDLLDFVNFRMETAESCLLLIENRRIADSLGLSRSLLENYLLLMLMCRGRKYFQLRDLSDLSEAKFRERLQEQEAELRELQAQKKSLCLAVKKYPRAKRHLMYVFEGPQDSEDPNFVIPIHFFEFQEFQPEAMRLNDDDYFQYYTPTPAVKKANRTHQQETAYRYRHYLSYDALLQCLELNGLVDPAVLARIEAHYTFLGKFLHPTHDAARSLHEGSNVYSGITAIGMEQRYTPAAVLLASLYVCYTVAGILGEIVGLFERAPSKYVKEAGTDALQGIVKNVESDFEYFWFLFNDPPLYDRFEYCIHHGTDEERVTWGNYRNVPKECIAFNQNIYGHLQQALSGWSNRRCGVYKSPLDRP